MAGDVVGDLHVLGLEERALGHRRIRAVGDGQALEGPRHLVAEITHGTAMKPRHALDWSRFLPRDVRERLEWIAVAEIEPAWLKPYEGVPGETLSPLNALEQESGLARRAKERVRAHRSEHVGEDFPVDRDQRMGCSQRPSIVTRGGAISHLISLFWSAPLSLAGPERKRYQIAGWFLAFAFISRF